MVRMGQQKQLITWFAVAASCFLVSCATKKTQDLDWKDAPKDKKAAASSATTTKKKEVTSTLAKEVERSVVVGPQELALLENMNKAVELYVVKKQPQEFTKLCKDKRFDCFVDEKSFPTKKKKVARGLPPYASGSKMGLQGENRVQIRYEFFP